MSLTAVLAAKEMLRYTPAGIAILKTVFTHESMQIEAGAQRVVQLELKVVAADAVALRLNQLDLGSRLNATGFLARKSKNSTHIVMHVTEFNQLEDV